MGWEGRDCLRKGNSRRSRTLAAGQRREIGRYEVDISAGLPGLRSGMILEVFQMAGMLAWEIESSNRLVR